MGREMSRAEAEGSGGGRQGGRVSCAGSTHIASRLLGRRIR